MLHAPTGEAKIAAAQSKSPFAPQPGRELHPHSFSANAVYDLNGAGSAASVRSLEAQQRQTLTGMQSMYGNQAVLRMMHSPQQISRKPALRPSQSIMLQRKCACGGSSESEGECAECKAKREAALQRRVANQGASPAATAVPPIVHDVLSSSGQPLDAGTRASMEPRFGRDFSGVPTYSVTPALQMSQPASQLVGINGVPAAGSLEDLDELFVSGPPTPALAPDVTPPSPLPPSPPAKAAPTCPTSIQVGLIGTLDMDEDFAKAGWLTGWGGFAQMEVADAEGKDWAGTVIHENLKNITNTCGEKQACSNAHGEGGKAGSTFKVGEGGDFLGLTKLPAEKNKFWDLHVIGLKGVSLLRKLGKPSCEIQCEQYYDCASKRFGPNFIVTYSMERDVIKSGGKSYNVTRIKLKKEAKK